MPPSSSTPSNQAPGWCFTVNNFTEEDKTYIKCLLDKQGVDYIVFGEETAPTTGTPHLQGYIHFKAKRRFKTVKELLPAGAHIEAAKGTAEHNKAYCTKDGTGIVEVGELPSRGAGSPTRTSKGGKATADNFSQAIQLAKEQKFEDIDPKILLRHYSAIMAIARANPPQVKSIPQLNNFWIYGASGGGKSRSVREWATANGYTLYSKPKTKWWDGYLNEDIVLIEDVDKYDPKLSYHLKIWGDHYPFTAEIKNGAFKLRPKMVIVTAQYKPFDIFEDLETCTAIERRYHMITFDTELTDEERRTQIKARMREHLTTVKKEHSDVIEID